MAAGTAQLRLRARGAGAAVLAALAVAGCVPPDLGTPGPATRTPVPAPEPPPAVVTRPVPVPPPVAPGSAEPLPAPTPAAPRVSPASQALLKQSRGYQATGNYGQAAAAIERALRIDPRQPLLWLELGNIRLMEADFAQAESLGRKALSLSAGDPTLTAQATELIAKARRR